MSDNRRRYHAIKSALEQLWPTELKGNVARHLHTLAALISGIVGSKSTRLPAIAANLVPDGAKKESRVKHFSRNRLIYVDPARTDYVVPFNVLATQAEHPYDVAASVLEAFRRTWPECLSEAPHFSNIVMAALIALIENGLTLMHTVEPDH